MIREEPACWLRLPRCTRVSTTADHVIPISQAPWLRMSRENCRGACASCNMRRQDCPINELPALRAALLEADRQQPQTTSSTTHHPDPRRRARRHIASQRRPSETALAFFGGAPTSRTGKTQSDTAPTQQRANVRVALVARARVLGLFSDPESYTDQQLADAIKTEMETLADNESQLRN